MLLCNDFGQYVVSDMKQTSIGDNNSYLAIRDSGIIGTISDIPKFDFDLIGT